MKQTIYKKIYPTEASSREFYGPSEIHKKDIPLRPIVSSGGSDIWVAKELARILKPPVGRMIHHVNNTMEFTDEMKNTKLEEGECITSCNVSALFTSISVASAIDLVKNRLEQGTELPKRSIMSGSNIIKLNNINFLFQGQFFL